MNSKPLIISKIWKYFIVSIVFFTSVFTIEAQENPKNTGFLTKKTSNKPNANLRATYCTPSTTSNLYWISNFTTTGAYYNITNPTTYSTGGYGDYSALSVNQSAGLSFNFNVSMNSSTHGINIWVDWNNNGNFLDTGEKVYASGSYVTGATGSITIPTGTANGSYRLRIGADLMSTNPNPCATTSYTEFEDYTILVSPAPTCYTPVLTTNVLSMTSANASWTPSTSGNMATGYEYVLSTTNTIPTGSGTVTAVASANFTGLTPNTVYYLFVRSNCGPGDYSPWVSSSFITGYCLSTSVNSGNYIKDFSTTGGTTNITNNGTGYSTGGYGNYITKVVSQYPSGNINFTANFDGIYTYGCNIWIDWNDDLDFNDAGELIYSTGGDVASSVSTVYTLPANAPVGNHRIRIRADKNNSNPLACSVIQNGETEDYTINVLTPLPCGDNPSSLSVFIQTQTSAIINWVAPTPAPANGYQYYLSTTNTPPTTSTVPTGSAAAGTNSVTLTGLTSSTVYYVWVRSNCGGTLGQGIWIGPVSFTLPNCSLGSGIGTTSLGCPNVIAGGLGLNGADPAPITCSGNGCVDLEATYLNLGDTTDYRVESINYSPPYQFSCLRNKISVNIDDVWSPIVNLPFNFCFYGNTYNKCQIGSNGVITFNTPKPTTAGGCNFSIYNNIPIAGNSSLVENSVFGVFHDINPARGGEVGYELITLNTGCRALVVSWSNVPMYYNDPANDYTGMVVFYENTNVIEVYIQKKRITTYAGVSSAIWNDGNAVVGIQNATGTRAVVPPGRNSLDPNWTATNEAWRFTPSGNSSTTSFKWYEGAGTTGSVIGTTNIINVCPSTTKVYTAEVTYSLCNGTTYKVTDQVNVTVNKDKVWNGSVSTDWNTANNWTPSGVPTNAQSVAIPGGVPNDAVVSGTTTAYACSLTVDTNGKLTINSGSSLVVTNSVDVAPTGNFTIQDSGSLVQINNNANTGKINQLRNVSIRKQDYVYWSSPVASFPVSSISTGTDLGSIFSWTPTTPTTYASNFGNWINTNENMVLGKGYIVRGPGSFTNTSASLFTSTFVGVPNNGNITTSITRGGYTGANYNYINASGSTITVTKDDDNWNLVGNPYPSAINADKFLTTNTNIAGYIKLWSHGTLPSSTQADPFYGDYVYNYTPADYHTYNLSGANSGPGIFNGNIATGQGFFVLMNDSAPTSANISFNNTMRIDASNQAYNNSNFFKNGGNSYIKSTKNRIWLDLVESNSNRNIRTLLAYNQGATNANDRLYDANTDEKLKFNIYTLLDNQMLTIQGREIPFDDQDRVPLGIMIPRAGNYKIAIAAVDGLFTETAQNILLEDKELNLTHNLKQAPYSFTANQGKIENRFIVKYTVQNSGLTNTSSQNGVKIFASSGIHIKSDTQKIKEIIIYDVLGKKIIQLESQRQNDITITEIKPTTNVILVKVILENGDIVTEKVIY